MMVFTQIELKKYWSVLLVLIGFTAAAQVQVLKLEDAVSLALSSNYDVIIAKQQEEATKTKIHIGEVGFLPTVDGSAFASTNVASSDLKFAQDAFPEVDGQLAGQSNQSAKLSASYILLNGGVRLRSYQKLKLSGELAEVQSKITLEAALINTVNGYYEVVRVQEQVELLKNVIEISKDRLMRMQTNYEFGNAGKIDLLNAEVDLNSDSAALLNAELALSKAKNQLNYVLGRPMNAVFTVESAVETPLLGSWDDILGKTKANNTSVMLSNIQVNMSDKDVKINKSVFLPVLSTTVDYGYQRNTNDVGIIQESSSLGYTAAINLSWNLFDGLKKQRSLEQAKINVEINQNKQNQTLLKLEQEARNYFDALKTNMLLLDFESANRTVAEVNLERSKELLLNGSITNVQFRQAQLNLLQVENKINNYKYAIKVYEYQLRRMTNELVN